MQNDPQSVAATILSQLGGSNRLAVMTGANNFRAGKYEVMFNFKMCRQANFCRITLDPLSDTYKFELMKFSPKWLTYTGFYQLEGVYNDMLVELFESKTGLRLSL